MVAVCGCHCGGDWVSGRHILSFTSEAPSLEPSLAQHPIHLVKATHCSGSL